jgi:hypothetical protein
MPSLLIRIDPGLLKHPDLDLRPPLVERLSEQSNGCITEGGYDYEDGTNALLIFPCIGDLATVAQIVVNVLEPEEILGSWLAGASTLGLSTTEEAEVASDYRVIPGTKQAAPWVRRSLPWGRHVVEFFE